MSVPQGKHIRCFKWLSKSLYEYVCTYRNVRVLAIWKVPVTPYPLLHVNNTLWCQQWTFAWFLLNYPVSRYTSTCKRTSVQFSTCKYIIIIIRVHCGNGHTPHYFLYYSSMCWTRGSPHHLIWTMYTETETNRVGKSSLAYTPFWCDKKCLYMRLGNQMDWPSGG